MGRQPLAGALDGWHPRHCRRSHEFYDRRRIERRQIAGQDNKRPAKRPPGRDDRPQWAFPRVVQKLRGLGKKVGQGPLTRHHHIRHKARTLQIGGVRLASDLCRIGVIHPSSDLAPGRRPPGLDGLDGLQDPDDPHRPDDQRLAVDLDPRLVAPETPRATARQYQDERRPDGHRLACVHGVVHIGSGARQEAVLRGGDVANRKPGWLWKPSLWASWRPFGIGLTRPNNFGEVFRAIGENKGRRRYALRILRHGVCDGCALGTSGMRDWTQSGMHLCNIRLRLLRLNTIPPFEKDLLADLSKSPRVSRQQDSRRFGARPLDRLDNRALRDLGRIPTPLIRRHGENGFTPISWDEALGLVAARITATVPDRIGFFLTARGLPNETYYAAQKAARAMGTNHIDNAARICHSPSTFALKDALGVGASTCSYRDWIGTDLVVFFGSNVANNQPVATKYLYLARKAGTRVAVVNAMHEPGMERYWIPSVAESALFGTKLATDTFLVGVGGDIAFLTGVMKVLIDKNLHDRDFIARHTEHFDALSAHVAGFGFAELEQKSGATRDDMERLADLVGASKRAVFVWSMGMTQHTFGEDAVHQILNLGLLRGFIGEEGSGMMPIRGHSGVQGGAEMGAYATAFPGGLAVNAEHARTLAAHWGFPVPETPGQPLPDLLDRADTGEVDVFWAVGGNFPDVLPDPDRVTRALAQIPMRVHQDLVLTRQMFIPPAREDGVVLLLPAMTRYEVPGGVTQTSTERRLIFSPEIPGPRVPDARWEGEVLLELARRVRPEHAERIGHPTTAELRQEIDRVVPMYAGIGRLQKKGDQFQYGGPRLCEGRVFPTESGRARFGVVPLPERHVPEGHFLVTTRRGKQFNSIVHEDLDRLTGARRDEILIHPRDLARLSLNDGAPIVVTSPFGSLTGRARAAPVSPGSLQVHWPEGNHLLDPHRRSSRSRIPDFNAVATVAPARDS